MPSEPIKRSVAAIKRRLARLGAKLPVPRHEHLYEGWTASELATRPFINIGAGRFHHPYWKNVDYGSGWYAKDQKAAFVEYDLTALAPLPFDDAAITLAYTSHTIEHVDDRAVENLLHECHRVLRPGGALRVTCPDAGLLYRSVELGARGYWRWRYPWFKGRLSSAPSLDAVALEDFLVREIATSKCRFYVHRKTALSAEEVRELARVLSREDLLNTLIDGVSFDPDHPGDHINWWTEEKLIAALQRAGFSTVYTSRRGQSLFAPLTDADRFDTTQPSNSLYVEAVR